jgi:hypothetical protein
MKFNKRIVIATLVLTSSFAAPAWSQGTHPHRSGDRSGRIASDSCGRNAGDGYCGYKGYESSLLGGSQGGQRDVWGHWGDYYGPMVHAP